MQVLETDVLVIGGGAAGAFAAINVADLGARVAVVSKSLLGRGGCSATFGFTGGAHRPRLQPVDPAEDRGLHDRIRYWTHYLGDQEVARDAIAYAPTFYQRMEAMGLYFRRTDDGTLVTCGTSGYGPISAKFGTTGKGIMDILRSQVFARGIPVLEEATATTLIVGDGRVLGACVFDYAHGELYEIRSKVVILATGHVNYLWPRTTASREMAANGLVMAFRAGAELCGIEICWWHIADLAHPRSWMRFHMYPNAIPMTDAVTEYYDSAGELFFHGNMYPRAHPAYYLQCKHLAPRIQQGLARKDGGYYAFLGNIPREVLDGYTVLPTYLRKIGLDPYTDRIECGMTAHQMRGGVLMDHSMATRVPGLLVAGSVAADFSTGIISTCWEAEVAARTAVEHAGGLSLEANPSVARREEQRVGDLLDARLADPVLPSTVQHRLRELMWREMDYFKSEEKIRRAIAGICELRETLVPRMQVPSKSRAGNWDLVAALDVGDMLDAAQLICTASLNRQESRGPFYRTDYPFVDNEVWLRNVVLGGTVAEPAVRFQPVNTIYTRPEEKRADFLTTEY